MVFLLVFSALIAGSALAAPPGPHLPKSVMGLYQNIPSQSENFEEFIKIFDLPKYTKFDERNLLGFWKEGDTYYERVVYWPRNLRFELSFKLGEPQSVPLFGKQFEYVYTLENGESPDTPVLNIRFSEVGGIGKFTARAVFTKNGLTVEYARDSIKAKRSYRRTLPPYALGAFEADPAHPVSQEALDFFNTAYPLPGGLKWSNNSKLWLSRHEDHYEEKMFTDPSFYIKRKFNIGEPGTYHLNGETVQYNLAILEANPNSTTIRNDITSPKGNLVITSVFDRKGSVKVTVKTDKQEFISHYKRVLPWMHYGTFEDIPEKAENWEEALKGHDTMGRPRPKPLKSYTIYRKSDDEYGVYRLFTDGSHQEQAWKLDSPTEIKLADGKTLQLLAVTATTANQTYLTADSDIDGKKFSWEDMVKPCGSVGTVRWENQEAKRHYRRVISKTALGIFESPAFTDAELKTYTDEHGFGHMLNKLTLEISETSNHTLKKIFTVNGGEPTEVHFTLGEPSEVKNLRGKSAKSTHFYYEVDEKPVLLNLYESGNSTFRMANVFNAGGLEVTYVFGDKIGKRTFTRRGPEVPYQPKPSQ